LVAAVAAGAIALWLGQRQSEASARLAAVRREEAALRSRFAQLEGQWQATQEKLAVVDKDNGRLLQEVESGAVTRAAREQQPRLTRDMIDARYQQAQVLEREGDLAAALNAYLWCFDVGFLRTPEIMERIWVLGEKHAGARAALRERRDRIGVELRRNTEEADTIGDLIALNRVLGEPEQTLAFHDALPRDDARRRIIGGKLVSELLAARRYREAVEVLPVYTRMLLNLDPPKPNPARDAAIDAVIARESKTPEEAEKAQAQTRLARTQAQATSRKVVLEPVGFMVEGLAGMGDLGRARTLAEKALAFDPTPETRALVQRHLERAGQVELLEAWAQKK
jgi:hypothetical protein